MFERLALIGIGLIGSSIAQAARGSNLAAEIVCSARTSDSRQTALDLSIVDQAFASNADAAAGADLVILCTPVGILGAVAEEIAPVLRPGAIVTDVGSVKASVLNDVGAHMPEGVHFIPGHPVAGTEESGPKAGFPELFQDRWCILTPGPRTDDGALGRLSLFWQKIGSRVEIMDPEHHDLVLAITSHLPHLIAYNIVGTADDLEAVTQSEVIKYSAGGFRDFTRLAASDPTMWRDVFLNNREAVLEVLGRFSEDLSALQRAIRWRDGDALFDLFSHTRRVRRAIIDAGQESAAPNFGRDLTADTASPDSDVTKETAE